METPTCKVSVCNDLIRLHSSHRRWKLEINCTSARHMPSRCCHGPCKAMRFGTGQLRGRSTSIGREAHCDIWIHLANDGAVGNVNRNTSWRLSLFDNLQNLSFVSGSSKSTLSARLSSEVSLQNRSEVPLWARCQIAMANGEGMFTKRSHGFYVC